MSSQENKRANHVPLFKAGGVKVFRATKGEEYLAFIFAADIEGRSMRFFHIRALAKAVGLTLDADAFIVQKDEQRMGTVTSILRSASEQFDLTAWVLAMGWMWRPE